MKDKKIYEKVVAAYYKDLYRYAYWMTGSKSIAEDLTQESFAIAWKEFAKLEDIEKFKSWMITIMRRANYKRIKSEPVIATTQLELIVDHTQNIENEAEIHILRKNILKLEESYRDPLLLQMVSRLTTEEISEILNLEINTVSTRLFRAKKMLKDNMNKASNQNNGEKNG